jgi:anti-sigma28 factor (negative regulator of flagellin synthesis)
MPNTVSDIASQSTDQKMKSSTTQANPSKSVDQMSALVNLVKMSPENPFHTQVMQTIKTQIQRDYYQVDMNTLVSHLYQELSMDGVA